MTKVKGSLLDRTMRKIHLIEMLRELKRHYTYKELSIITGISIPVLNRYIKGRVLPRDERVEFLERKLNLHLHVKELVRKNVRLVYSRYVEDINLTGNVPLLKIVSKVVHKFFGNTPVTKVLTAAVDGIPLATVIAYELSVPVVIAKSRKEIGIRKYYEASYYTEDATLVTLYVPQQMLKPSDNVLIVDDLIRTARTLVALIEITEKAKANLVGIFSLIAVGDLWRETLKRKIPLEKVKVVYEIG